MLLPSRFCFWRAAVAAAVSVLVVAEDPTPKGQSTFISPDGSLAFGFTVPDNGNSDVFFTMRAHVSSSWAAVGLGSDDMKGALFLMVYRDEAGTNVTFSPRLAYGNYEPSFYPDLRYELLPGTGVVGEHMMLVVKCIEHCRSWPAAGSNSGYIDVSSPNQKAIYALGPRDTFGSNSRAADLKFHREFGVFTMDMKRTQGSPDAPVLDAASKAVGTKIDYSKSHKVDYKAGLHGGIMFFSVVVMLPLGVALLRLGRWARWHGVSQAVAVAGVLAGLSLGVVTSFNYQRSRGFRSYHQILGFVVVALILGQFTLGVLSYQRRRKSQEPTKLSVPHRWLGRIVIFFGTLNAILGFTFALNRIFAMLLVGLLLFIAFSICAYTIGRQYMSKMRQARGAGGPGGAAPTGYPSQPWRAEQRGAPGGGYASDPPPGYDAPSQQIGLQTVSPPAATSSPWKSSDAKDFEDQPALGVPHRPREFA